MSSASPASASRGHCEFLFFHFFSSSLFGFSFSLLFSFFLFRSSTLTPPLLSAFLRSKNQTHTIALSNSEIYNHVELREKHLPGVPIVNDSKSDSAIVGHLFKALGDVNEVWDSLDGIFACVVVDEATREFVAARDPMGICPLYWGKKKSEDGKSTSTWFSSEMKCLEGVCDTYEIFPPGHVYRSKTDKLERYYKPSWLDEKDVPTTAADPKKIHDALVSAVVKRLMSDAPLGVLLSGGLDSSLVASIAMR